MKKYSFIIQCFLLGLSFIACNSKQNDNQTNINNDSIDAETITVADSSVYGHLGEETGMSSIELITFDGDTLSLNKTNESTGEPGILLGEISNYTDTFAVIPDANKEYMNIAVNINQLCRKWVSSNNADRKIELNSNGSAISSLNGDSFTKWKLLNCKMVLEGNNSKNKPLYDTICITHLSLDSLSVKWNDNNKETFYPENK